MLYNKITNNISVSVDAFYLEEESSPENDYFVWGYTIKISNQGGERVQLVSRRWQITDSNGIVYEVSGAGVLGQQPTLDPGDEFEYTSGTPLGASSGIMVGSYYMETNDGEVFMVDIPAFSLDSPYATGFVH